MGRAPRQSTLAIAVAVMAALKAAPTRCRRTPVGSRPWKSWAYGAPRRCVMRSRHLVSCRLAVLALASMVIAAIVLVPRAAAGPPGLAAGDARFWDGEYVAESRGGLAAFEDYFFAPPEAQAAVDPCVTGLAFCRRYPFDVATGGAALRVALDSSK